MQNLGKVMALFDLGFARRHNRFSEWNSTVSYFSYAPSSTNIFRQEGLNQTFFILFYLSTFYGFDDTEKHRNRICNHFASLKAHFDKIYGLLRTIQNLIYLLKKTKISFVLNTEQLGTRIVECLKE